MAVPAEAFKAAWLAHIAGMHQKHDTSNNSNFFAAGFRAALAAPAQQFTPAFADGLLHSTVLHKLWEESEPTAQRGQPGALAWQLGVFAGKVAQAAAAPAQAVPSGMWTIWEALPGYLIDHCEGETITEEMLQRALEAMLKDPQYSMPPVAPAQEHATQLAGKGQAYSIDADPQGIRARVADAITGALAFGAQGGNTPTPEHWLTPFWMAARFEAAQTNALRGLMNAQLAAAAPIQAQEDARDLEAEALRACRDLPEGWEIVIRLEKGYGGVVLIDPEYNENDLPVDGKIFDALKESIDQAVQADAARAAQGES